MNKELLLRIREILFWIILISCLALCNQHLGYKTAEKDILKSCSSNNEFTIEGIKLICVRCPTDKKAKDEE